jgi:hypothetical protein
VIRGICNRARIREAIRGKRSKENGQNDLVIRCKFAIFRGGKPASLVTVAWQGLLTAYEINTRARKFAFPVTTKTKTRCGHKYFRGRFLSTADAFAEGEEQGPFQCCQSACSAGCGTIPFTEKRDSSLNASSVLVLFFLSCLVMFRTPLLTTYYLYPQHI